MENAPKAAHGEVNIRYQKACKASEIQVLQSGWRKVSRSVQGDEVMVVPFFLGEWINSNAIAYYNK